MKLQLALKRSIPIAIVISLIFGSIYAAGQYILRADANDPQVQIAEDSAQKLADGLSITNVFPSAQVVDIQSSLSPFIISFDGAGKVIWASARLNGKTPSVPQGVLDHAKAQTDNRITWQPANGVRSAIVVKHYSGKNSGFVLVGRSLRETEKREDQLLLLVGFAWLVTLTAAFLGLWIKPLLPTKITRSHKKAK